MQNIDSKIRPFRFYYCPFQPIRRTAADFCNNIGPKQTSRLSLGMSAFGGKADIAISARHVRFSNRPFGVKHFQTIRRCSVDVAHGLVLLFGIGTRALPSWDSKTRWNDLLGGLADRVGRSKRTCELTSSIVPRGTSFHRWVDSRVTSYSV